MTNSSRAVVIGASAGALEALSGILPLLPREFGAPVLVVVHVPPDRPSVLAELFQQRCAVTVKEAEDKEPAMAGTVYFAPPNYHLLVERQGSLALSSDEQVLFSRPSIDVLFESAADAYGPQLTAIVLSGANHDGARGLAAVVRSGGTALVQAPETASATAMPEAALASCPTALAMPTERIAQHLIAMDGTP